MRILIWISIAVCVWGQSLPQSERDVIRTALSRARARDGSTRDLLYQRRQIKKELTADGQEKSRTVVVIRRDPWDELIVTRVIQRDDKPLTELENVQQEEKLRKGVEDRRKNPPKVKPDEDTWMDEAVDAFDFKKLAAEERYGRPTDVYDFQPKPGYKAKQMRARALEKIRGKIWIDRQDGELVKVDVFVFDNLNFGFGMLGHVEKGTHFEMERKKLPMGIWFDDWNRVRFDARVMMVKSIRQEIESRYSNVSFRPSAKLVRNGSYPQIP